MEKLELDCKTQGLGGCLSHFANLTAILDY